MAFTESTCQASWNLDIWGSTWASSLRAVRSRSRIALLVSRRTQVFELATGDYLFDPKASDEYPRDEVRGGHWRRGRRRNGEKPKRRNVRGSWRKRRGRARKGRVREGGSQVTQTHTWDVCKKELHSALTGCFAERTEPGPTARGVDLAPRRTIWPSLLSSSGQCLRT